MKIHTFKIFIISILTIFPYPTIAQQIAPKVEFTHHLANQSIEIKIGGKHFTTFLYADSLLKPILYPIKTPQGTLVTRGYPIAPRPNEYTDHPHHVGHWFSYGSVNNIDFWNSSSAIPTQDKMRYGFTKVQAITELTSGTEGRLSITSLWIANYGDTLLREKSTFIFAALDSNTWYFDRIITLSTYRNQDIQMYDNKEGMFAIRVAHELEQPIQKAEYATDSNGKPTKDPVLLNETATGKYTNSYSVEKDEVWGKRAEWVKLEGQIGKEKVAIAILDNQKNVGSPAYWHARGYGLFAVNNLGEKIFTEGKKERKYLLLHQQPTVFKYRLIVNTRTGLSFTTLNGQFEQFSK
jgi:hypothetical protein